MIKNNTYHNHAYDEYHNQNLHIDRDKENSTMTQLSQLQLCP